MNNKGQGLVEYLILICLVGVSAIAVVSVVGQNIKSRYASISSALRADKTKAKLEKPNKRSYEKHDFGNYEEAMIKQ